MLEAVVRADRLESVTKGSDVSSQLTLALASKRLHRNYHWLATPLDGQFASACFLHVTGSLPCALLCHIVYKGFVVPLLYCLLSDKRRETYHAVFDVMKQRRATNMVLTEFSSPTSLLS